MIIIENKFDLKEFVYLKTDPDQLKRQLIAIQVDMEGALLYELSCGTHHAWYYADEMSLERDLIQTTYV